MKKLLLIYSLMTLSCHALCAQQKETNAQDLITQDETGKYTHQTVVAVDGISQEELFKRAATYIKSTFKTADNNIQFDDKEFYILNTGTIILPAQPKNSFFQYQKAAYNFKIELWFKDGKYRVVVSNIMVYVQWDYNWTETKTFQEYAASTKKKYQKLAETVRNSIANVLSDLENAIKNGNQQNNKDW